MNPPGVALEAALGGAFTDARDRLYGIEAPAQVIVAGVLDKLLPTDPGLWVAEDCEGYSTS
jgi:hypothetical protein